MYTYNVTQYQDVADVQTSCQSITQWKYDDDKRTTSMNYVHKRLSWF